MIRYAIKNKEGLYLISYVYYDTGYYVFDELSTGTVFCDTEKEAQDIIDGIDIHDFENNSYEDKLKWKVVKLEIREIGQHGRA